MKKIIIDFGRSLWIAAIVVVVMSGLCFFSAFQAEQGKTASEPQREPTPTVQFIPLGQAPPSTPTPAPTALPISDTTGWRAFTSSSLGITYRYPSDWASPFSACLPPPEQRISSPPPGCVLIEVVSGQKVRDISGEMADGEAITVSGYPGKKKVREPVQGGLQIYVYTILAYDNKGDPFRGLTAYIPGETPPEALDSLIHTLDQLVATISLGD